MSRTVDSAPGVATAQHRTLTLDFGVVVEGSVELVLDSGEAILLGVCGRLGRPEGDDASLAEPELRRVGAHVLCTAGRGAH